MNRKVISIIVVFLSAFLLVSCADKAADKTVNGRIKGKAKVVSSRKPVKVKVIEVPARSKEAELPKDFSKDVPLFEGAKVVNTAVTGDSSLGNLMAAFEVKGVNLDDVSDFYLSDMLENGWREINRVILKKTGSKSFSFEKGNKTASIAISAQSREKVRITINISTHSR